MNRLKKNFSYRLNYNVLHLQSVLEWNSQKYRRKCWIKVTCSKNFLILETVIGSGVIAVVSYFRLVSHKNTHIRATFVASVCNIFRVVHSNRPLWPFLSTWLFSGKSFVPLVHIVDHIIVVVLPLNIRWIAKVIWVKSTKTFELILILFLTDK